MWHCLRCGKENYDSSRYCIACGEPSEIDQQKRKRDKRKKNIIRTVIIAAVVCMLAAAAAAVLFLPGSSRRKNEKKIAEYLSSDAYIHATLPERKEMVSEYLDTLGNENAFKGAPVYDEATAVFSFEFSDGVSGGIMIKDFPDGLNATGGGSILCSEQQQDGLSIRTGYPCSGSALVLNAFENTAYRRDFYRELKSEWNSMGLDTQVDQSVSISDLKRFERYDVVILAMHGGLYKDTIILLPNGASSSYWDDIKYRRYLLRQELVVLYSGKFGWQYCPVPAFFSDVYGSGDLDNMLIFSESCQFYGDDSVSIYPDRSFADSVFEKSDCTVFGYHNSVESGYSRNVMRLFVIDIARGMSLENAFSDVVSKYGANDDYENPFEGKYKAYPIMITREKSGLVLPEVSPTPTPVPTPTPSVAPVDYKQIWRRFVESQYPEAALAVAADVTRDGIPECMVIMDFEDKMEVEGYVWRLDDLNNPVKIHEEWGGYCHAQGFFDWYLRCSDTKNQYYDLGWYYSPYQEEGYYSWHYLSQNGEKIKAPESDADIAMIYSKCYYLDVDTTVPEELIVFRKA